MKPQKMALGRGLGALIEESTIPKEIVQAVEASNEIDINLIDVNPYQPRKDFDEEALQELSVSIKQLGIIQPITLRKQDNGRFQIIAGERRFRASKLAGLKKVPAYIRSTDDQGMLELALVENIHRADLNSIEVAISYQRLIDECSLTQELLSDRVGKKRATIANYLRLLRLPAEIQLGLREEKLTMGHARALITVDGQEKQIELFHKAVDQELSVREIEEMVRQLANPLPEVVAPVKEEKTTDKTEASQEYEDLRHHLSKHFESPVEFKRSGKGAGKIIISFKSDEDLERIVSVLDTKK
jgi:ParB family chromosome partitioning protein